MFTIKEAKEEKNRKRNKTTANQEKRKGKEKKKNRPVVNYLKKKS